MKVQIIIFILIMNFGKALGQEDKDAIYKFSRQTFTSEDYSTRSYDRFQGNIDLVGDNIYKFRDRVLTVNINDKRLLGLFEKGIFNPDEIFGSYIGKGANESYHRSSGDRTTYALIRNDSLTITNFTELVKLNPNPQTKRFLFWVLKPNVLNPEEYYLEISNEEATQSTDLGAFIENSKLTFFHFGSFIL